MIVKNSMAFGVYATRTGVMVAIEEFKSAGYKKSNLSVIFALIEASREFASIEQTRAPCADALYSGPLNGLGLSKQNLERCEVRMKSGGVFLAIYSNNSASTMMAGDILRLTGAQDISSTLIPNPGIDLLAAAGA